MHKAVLATLLLVASTAQAQDLDAHIRDLSSPDSGKREAAAVAIGELGAQAVGAVEALKRAVRDGNEIVRCEAIEALGKIGPAASEAAFDLAVVLEKDRSPVVRRVAVQALGRIRSDEFRAREALVFALSSRQLRPHVIRALGAIGAPALVQLRGLLRGGKRDRLNALRAIRLMKRPRPAPAPAPPGRGGVLIFGDPGEDDTTLVDFEEDVVRLLADQLSHDHESVRRAACDVFEVIGPQARAVVPILAETLTNKETRRAAAIALRRLGPEAAAAVPDLTESLSDPNDEVRVEVAHALAAIGPASTSAVQQLIELLDDEEVMVRVWTARALAAIGPKAKAAIPALVRVARPEWLQGPKDPPKPGGFVFTGVEFGGEADDALIAIGTAAIPALEEQARDADPRVARMAKELIARIKR